MKRSPTGPSRNPDGPVDKVPGWSVDQLEAVLVKCIQTGDADGVHAALTIMAAKDPHRAELLLKTIEVGFAMRREEAS